MVQVGRVVGKVHALAQVAPVFRDFIDAIAAKPAEVVHHRVSAAIAIGAFAAGSEDDVIVLKHAGIAKPADEALYEGAVDAVVAHPGEVPQDGGLLEGAEDFRDAAIRMMKAGGEAFLGRELGDIGPQIDLGIAGRQRAAALGPVEPAAIRAVALEH